MELKIYRAKEAAVDKSILAKKLTNKEFYLQIETKRIPSLLFRQRGETLEVF